MPETVTLYRSVSLAEYESIMMSKQFSIPPGGNEMKQFAFTQSEAIAYAKTDLNAVAIIAVTVEKSIISEAWVSKTIDPFIFKNGVVSVPMENIATINKSAIKIWHSF